MNLIFNILLFFAPLFSWGKASLYLDTARLGFVRYDETSRVSLWAYTDIIFYEKNSISTWHCGLKPIPLAEQPLVSEIVEKAEITPYESDEYLAGTTYYIGSQSYDPGKNKGPWSKIDNLLSRLAPTAITAVSDSAPANTTSCVYGQFYSGDVPTFRSAAGVFELKAPEPSLRVQEYLKSRSQKSGLDYNTLSIQGILYLQGGLPLFFYLIEE
jgi:hypothetical protein